MHQYVTHRNIIPTQLPIFASDAEVKITVASGPWGLKLTMSYDFPAIQS